MILMNTFYVAQVLGYFGIVVTIWKWGGSLLYYEVCNYILNYISCKIPLLANCMPYNFPLAKRPKVERMSHLHTICAVCTYTYCANIPTVAILLLFTSFHNIFVCAVKCTLSTWIREWFKMRQIRIWWA